MVTKQKAAAIFTHAPLVRDHRSTVVISHTESQCKEQLWEKLPCAKKVLPDYFFEGESVSAVTYGFTRFQVCRMCPVPALVTNSLRIVAPLGSNANLYWSLPSNS